MIRAEKMRPRNRLEVGFSLRFPSNLCFLSSFRERFAVYVALRVCSKKRESCGEGFGESAFSVLGGTIAVRNVGQPGTFDEQNITRCLLPSRRALPGAVKVTRPLRSPCVYRLYAIGVVRSSRRSYTPFGAHEPGVSSADRTVCGASCPCTKFCLQTRAHSPHMRREWGAGEQTTHLFFRCGEFDYCDIFWVVSVLFFFYCYNGTLDAFRTLKLRKWEEVPDK